MIWTIMIVLMTNVSQRGLFKYMPAMVIATQKITLLLKLNI